MKTTPGESPNPTRNIHWRELTAGEDVRLIRSSYFTQGNRLVYWHSHEAREARRTLNKRVKANTP